MSNIVVMNKPYNDELALLNVMRYCAGETVDWHKCEFHGGMGVDTTSYLTMVESMNYAKKYFNQRNTRQLHHIVINIQIPIPNGVKKNNGLIKKELDSVDPIARDISKLIWEKGYQNSVFYHVDADRPHLHFVINPIDKRTGKQMRNVGGFANELLYFLKCNYRDLGWNGVVYRKEDEI